MRGNSPTPVHFPVAGRGASVRLRGFPGGEIRLRALARLALLYAEDEVPSRFGPGALSGVVTKALALQLVLLPFDPIPEFGKELRPAERSGTACRAPDEGVVCKRAAEFHEMRAAIRAAQDGSERSAKHDPLQTENSVIRAPWRNRCDTNLMLDVSETSGCGTPGATELGTLRPGTAEEANRA